MMIEMPRDERNVDVAALADRLAIVHRLENCQTPRVLLHLAGERIEIARALMAAQRLPCRKSLARRCHRGVHIGRVALGDFGDALRRLKDRWWSCTRRSPAQPTRRR